MSHSLGMIGITGVRSDCPSEQWEYDMVLKVSQAKVVYSFTSVREAADLLLRQYPTVTDFYEMKDLHGQKPSMVRYVVRKKDRKAQASHDQSRDETHVLLPCQAIDLRL